MIQKKLAFLVCFALTSAANGKDILTNAVHFKNAPEWLKGVRIETVTEKIQYQLEWSTRRVNVFYYPTQELFSKAHSLGPVAAAVTKSSKTQQSIHLGPKVNDKNFDKIFGHELVHVIFAQKYRGAIPKWLEEGLANHLAKKNPVNYKKMAKLPFPEDVRDLAHPYKGKPEDIRYRYVASQALAEMLDKKCGLENLIRLSVERKMVDYIKTYCEIKDINKEFQNWVISKAKGNYK